MKIKLKKFKIREIVGDNRDWFTQDEESGRVFAMDGKLDIRPEYQREFVYKEKQRNAVIQTVLNNFPLNILYFVDRKDGSYEVLDGQQRLIFICQYAEGKFSVNIPSPNGGFDSANFGNLFPENQEAFLDYELQVYICEGTEEEKLNWFRIINIAGEVLSDQELRNALYHSKWLTDAKSLFSRANCPAKKNYGKYLKGKCDRQEYLETAFLWKADSEGIKGKDIVSEYMKIHRNDKDANELWNYFEKVFNWVEDTFGNFDKDTMVGLPWGLYYNKHKDDILDKATVQKEIKRLLLDEEVTNKKGIYAYILTGEEKYLSLRAFDEKDRLSKYEEQDHKCAICENEFELKDMHADHIKPWSKGGKTTYDNLQMLCTTCNLKKSNK